ncbi:hypothetical protein CDAR_498291 [Caerostris darwini]|uniref:Uncharacterized protein n=1 Tax=Caerostris darwini TaxID=1538125 RepID=A0AAV4U012_9ARAC|nr:hypothetical protein CDAR_498291 [Caerostris darwini]
MCIIYSDKNDFPKLLVVHQHYGFLRGRWFLWLARMEQEFSKPLTTQSAITVNVRLNTLCLFYDRRSFLGEKASHNDAREAKNGVHYKPLQTAVGRMEFQWKWFLERW